MAVLQLQESDAHKFAASFHPLTPTLPQLPSRVKEALCARKLSTRQQAQDSDELGGGADTILAMLWDSDSDDEVHVVDHPTEHRAATHAEKGKTMADANASSSGADVVLDRYGKPVKLNGPIDVTWSHGEPYPGPHGAGFKCFYCFTTKKGGGVSRLKEHLGHILGSVEAGGV